MTVCKTSAYVRGFGHFFRVWPTLYAEKTPIPAWDEMHNLGWPKKLNGPWKLKNFAWNRKRRTWGVTWIKRCRISPNDAPGIRVGSFELKWVKISNDMEFLNFLLFIEFFYPLWLFLTILDRFELIWWCRSPFWARFDHGSDSFIPISGIMSTLAYRLGFTSVCTLHDLMTVSL